MRSKGYKKTQVIPLHDVVWAEASENAVVVQYTRVARRKRVCVNSLYYTIEKTNDIHAASWVINLLDHAYGPAQRRKKIKLLINPFSGQGKALKYFLRDVEPIFAAARCHVDVEHTLHRGHAIDIAEKLDINAYDAIACCSGDGLPHEVFNGLGRKLNAVEALSKVAVVQLPCGTGNAMSLNLNGTDSPGLAALAIVKGLRTPLDLTSITQGDQRILSFLSQSVGMVADVDLGTENVRWMGSARFTYGFLVRIMGKTVYPCDLNVKIDMDSKPEIQRHFHTSVLATQPVSCSSDVKEASLEGNLPSLKFGNVRSSMPTSFTEVNGHRLGNFYAGNMALMAPDANFFPASLPSDGYLDLITIDGDVGRLAAIQTFFGVEKGTHFNMPQVDYRKVSGYRIRPLAEKGYISIDGESMSFKEFQAEVHHGLGLTLSRSGRGYEAAGVVPAG